MLLRLGVVFFEGLQAVCRVGVAWQRPWELDPSGFSPQYLLRFFKLVQAHQATPRGRCLKLPITESHFRRPSLPGAGDLVSVSAAVLFCVFGVVMVMATVGFIRILYDC